MSITTETAEAADTKQRLIEAAGEVFAARGFADATVRDICHRAGANIAAINYHFQGKERLYAAVLRHAYSVALEKFPPTHGLPPNATPQQRLHSFIRAFLLRIFDDGRPAWFGKLISREILEPTSALDELVTLSIRPQHDVLLSIIESISPGLSVEDSYMCLFSVVGQCLFYHHCRPVIERTPVASLYRVERLDRLAEHITLFSFEAIRAMKAGRVAP